MSRYAAIVLGLGLFGGCAELIDLDFNRCGNGLVEPDLGEECDNAVDSDLGNGLLCGPPNVPSQACQYVCGASGADCPRGWVCGVGDVCQHPTSEFVAGFGSSLGSQLRSLQSGDFDGDGRPDLLRSTRLTARLDYNDGRGAFVDGNDIPLPHSFDPAMADLNDDGKMDVALGFVVPLVLVGQSDRQLVPAGIANSLDEVLGTTDALGIEFIPHDNLFAGYVRVAGGMCILGSCNRGLKAALPDDADISPIIHVLSTTATSAILALAYPGDSKVLIVEEPGSRVTPVPVPRTVLGRLAVFDGDLIVRVESDDPTHADAVARVLTSSSGYAVEIDRSFEAHICIEPLCPQTFCPEQCQEAPPDGSPIRVFPLAVADFNEDGLSDILTPLSFLQQRADGEWDPTEGLFAPGDFYRVGFVGDLNRDGHRDILTLPDRALRLEVRLGTGNGGFVTTPLALRSRPDEIFLGDFDGDLLDDDIAFIEPGADADLLSVLYNEAPLFRERRFPILGEVEATTVIAPTNSSATVVVTIAPEGETDRGIVFFEGSTYQLMLSFLRTQAAAEGATLGYLGTPRFDASGASILGAWNSELGPWLWRREGGRRFVRREIQLEGTECPSLEIQPCLSIVSSPLERDSANETLLMVVSNRCGDTSPEPRIISGIRGSGSDAISCSARPIEPIESDLVLQGRTADLDGVGALEFMFLTSNELRIFWDYADNGEVLSLPFEADDFVVLNADEDAALEVFAVTPGRAQLYDVVDRTLVLKTEFELETPEAPIISRAVADDFTGDGLTDVVVADGLRYTLYRSVGSRDQQ